MKLEGHGLCRSYSSRLEHIDDFCGRAKNALEESGLKDHAFSVEILLREAMTNAILHGNHLEEGRQVSVCLKRRGNLIIIRVLDEGQGFACPSHSSCEEMSPKESGRGLQIYTHYASRVGFNRRGNGVVLSRRITRRERNG
jgi:serine/threonine-protein kinase RsbW